MIDSRLAPRIAIELDALRRYMEANVERIDHVATFMCRGQADVAPREVFEKAGRLNHKLAICQRRLSRLKQLPRA